MTFNEYQNRARKTAIYSMKYRILYPSLGLASEAGEVAGKVSKALRGDYSLDERREEIAKELGDVLWFLSATADDLGYSLEEIANLNLSKLHQRQLDGVIMGEGDNR